MIKNIYMSILIAAFIAKPAIASKESVHQIIEKKCQIEFSKVVAREKADFYAPLILKYAKKYDLPPEIIASVIWHESNFRPNCTSRYGAIGLMQVIPFAGRFPKGSNPYNPEVNISVGCRLLKGYLLRFGGDWQRALTAYNYGGTVVSRGMYRSRYSNAVLRSAGKIRGSIKTPRLSSASGSGRF